jgi:hypothetical protein
MSSLIDSFIEKLSLSELLLTLLSLTTECAQIATATRMLVGAYKRRAGFAPLVTGLRDVWVKHTITERSVSARITVVALHPVVFGLSYLYFPKEGTMVKMIE